MAKGSINKVLIIGNLGNDPDVRYMPNGSPAVTLSVATTEAWKDKNSGEKQERTEWHRVVLFNRLGEIAAEYLKKGAKIFIEGQIRTRKWQDKSGQDRYTTEIVANELQMLDGRSGGAQAGSSYSPAQKSAPAQQQQQAAPAAQEFDDDIPF